MRILVVKEGGTSWTLGSCSGTYGYQREREKQYIERCCLKPGEYTLSCQNANSKNSGWNGGSIEIQGQKYCDDFIGRRVMRQVEIKGMFVRLKLFHT